MDANVFIDADRWVERLMAAFTIGAGIYRYKKINIPSKALFWMVVFGYINDEITGIFQARNLNYTPILYFSYFFNFILAAIFFHFCIPEFRKIKIGIFIIVGSFVFFVTNKFFSHSINLLTSDFNYFYYVAFYILSCIGLSIMALYIMFQKSTWRAIRKNEIFWYLILTIFGDGPEFIYNIIIPNVKTVEMYIVLSFWVNWLPSDISAIALGILFLIFPKKDSPLINGENYV